MDHELVMQTIAKYSSQGIVVANELLLPTAIAILFIDDLAHAGVLILSIDTWRIVGEGVAEIPNNFTFSVESTTEDVILRNAMLAKECILYYLPANTDYVSCLFEDEGINYR